jgi:4'-phosphopantetheinyl transferase
MKALAASSWPGPTPAPQGGLFAILIQGGADADAGAQRNAARRQIRLAIREALAVVLSVPANDIAIVSSPGTPPRVLLAGAPSRIGCSFSHEGRYALAAVNLHGPIGADMMRIQDIPDWRAVARNYLGPSAANALQGCADLPRAFSKAWAQREAALKCHAQQLSEWQAELPGRSISLILPVPDLTAHIHIGDNNA